MRRWSSRRRSGPPCRRWPACMIALLKNTSVGAVFGSLRPPRGCAASPTTTPTSGCGIFLRLRARLHRARRILSFGADRARASLDGGAMSASVLFDAPGPQTVARHRVYTVVAAGPARRGRAGGLAALRQGPAQIRAVGAVRHTRLRPGDPGRRAAQDAADGFTAVISPWCSAFFGVGKLSDHAWVRWPCWAGRGVLPGRARAAADDLLLLLPRHRRGIGSYW